MLMKCAPILFLVSLMLFACVIWGPPRATAGTTTFLCFGASCPPTSPSPSPSASPTPNISQICVGGTLYTTTLDDEFTTDSTLQYTNSAIGQGTPPPGIIWSSGLFGYDATTNVGIFENPDDAVYLNPQGVGNPPVAYNPYSLSSQGLTITASPVPSGLIPQASPSPPASPLPNLGHWASGVLTSVPETYGYVEFSGQLPTSPGAWPAYWLVANVGTIPPETGTIGNTWPYVRELDGLEIFGNYGDGPGGAAYGASQTVIFNYQLPSPNPTAEPGYVTAFHTVSMPSGTSASGGHHTYGILWTPSIVSYYLDRQYQSSYPTQTNTGIT